MGLLKRAYNVLYGKMLYKQQPGPLPAPARSPEPVQGYDSTPIVPQEPNIDPAKYKYPEKRMGPDPDAPPWEPDPKPPLAKKHMGP